MFSKNQSGRAVGGLRAIAAVCVLFVAAGCHVVAAKVYNLEQLHDSESNHRYTAALENDLEFVLRHQLLGLFQGAGAQLAEKSTSKVDAPADECLAQLIELESYDPKDPFVSAQQVEWFSRLAVEDAWRLSRERAVIALGHAGARLSAGLPANLGADQHAADPDAVAKALAPIIRELRAVLDRAKAGERGTKSELQAACDAVRALDLDVAGARRALRVVADLADKVGTRDESVAPIRALSVDLQRVCIRRALGRAIDDVDPRVRGAALQSAAISGGRTAIDTVLFDRLKRDLEPDVAIAILDTVAAQGLAPSKSADSSKTTDAAKSDVHTQDEWLELIYGLLSKRPESSVRIHAMMALSKLSGAHITSLREEDWQTWWLAHRAQAEAKVSGTPR